MRQDITVSVIHMKNRDGLICTNVTVGFGNNTTTEQTFRVDDRHLTVAEALALVAVEMRMNGVPEAVLRAQPYRRY